MITQKTKQKGGKLVGKSHVEDLIRNYKKQRWVHNTDRLGKPDSLSAWFNREALEGFLEMAKDQHADGIKIFFGVYPESFPQNPEYAGRQTLVMVATKERVNAEGKTVNKEVYVQKDGHAEILAFNFSSLCPPDCGQQGPGDNELGISIFSHNDGMIVI